MKRFDHNTVASKLLTESPTRRVFGVCTDPGHAEGADVEPPGGPERRSEQEQRQPLLPVQWF